MPIGFPLLSPELVHSRKTYIFTVLKEIFPLNEFEVPKPFSLLHTYDFRSWWDNFHHVLKIDKYAYLPLYLSSSQEYIDRFLDTKVIPILAFFQGFLI